MARHYRHSIAHLVINDEISILNAIEHVHGLPLSEIDTFDLYAHKKIALQLLQGNMPSIKPIEHEIEAWGVHHKYTVRAILNGYRLKDAIYKGDQLKIRNVQRGKRKEILMEVRKFLEGFCYEHHLPSKLVHDCKISQVNIFLGTDGAATTERVDRLSADRKFDLAFCMFDRSGMDATSGLSFMLKDHLSFNIPKKFPIKFVFSETPQRSPFTVNSNDDGIVVVADCQSEPKSLLSNISSLESSLSFVIESEAQLKGYDTVDSWFESYAQQKKRKQKDKIGSIVESVYKMDQVELAKYIDILSRYAKSNKVLDWRTRNFLYRIKSSVLNNLLAWKVAKVVELVNDPQEERVTLESLKSPESIAKGLEKALNNRKTRQSKGYYPSLFRDFSKKMIQDGFVYKVGETFVVRQGFEHVVSTMFVQIVESTAAKHDEFAAAIAFKMLSSNDAFTKVFECSESNLNTRSLTKHYFSLWTIKVGDQVFHAPLTSIYRDNVSDGYDIVSRSDCVFGTAMTDTEMLEHPLGDVLVALGVNAFDSRRK